MVRGRGNFGDVVSPRRVNLKAGSQVVRIYVQYAQEHGRRDGRQKIV